jgi:hypothetical protein
MFFNVCYPYSKLIKIIKISNCGKYSVHLLRNCMEKFFTIQLNITSLDNYIPKEYYYFKNLKKTCYL